MKVTPSIRAAAQIGVALLWVGLARGQPAPGDAAQAHLIEPATIEQHPERVFLDTIVRAGDRLVAAGERGVIILSDDSGAHWRQQQAQAAGTLTSVRFADALHGWAVGHLGLILHTADGGLHWARQLDGARAAAAILSQAQQAADVTLPEPDHTRALHRLARATRLAEEGADKPFLAVLAETPNDALVVGAYNLAFVTTDGGAHWQPCGDRIANPSSLHLYALFRQDGVAYVAGEQGLLLRSMAPSDQVLQLTALKSPFAGSFFGGLAGPQNRLIVFGLEGTVLVSRDGGATWHRAALTDHAAINCGLVLADGTILLGDRAGRLIVSADHGETFAPLSGGGPGVNDLAEAADGTLVLATDGGIRRVDRAAVNAAVRAGSAR